MQTIALTGFMGCGKSSVGRILAGLLPGFEWIDLDRFIEEAQKKTISELFRQEGEAAFREMEAEALNTIFMIHHNLDRDCVLSLGGGTVTHPNSRSLLKRNTRCIYLRASVDTLEADLRSEAASRPMLQGGDSLRTRIETLMEERVPLYESLADYIIDIDGLTPDRIAREIITLLTGSLPGGVQ